MSLDIFLVFLCSIQWVSDSSSYRIKTPNKMIMAVCHTTHTAGRLSRTLLFFGRSQNSLKLWTQPIVAFILYIKKKRERGSKGQLGELNSSTLLSSAHEAHHVGVFALIWRHSLSRSLLPYRTALVVIISSVNIHLIINVSLFLLILLEDASEFVFLQLLTVVVTGGQTEYVSHSDSSGGR